MFVSFPLCIAEPTASGRPPVRPAIFLKVGIVHLHTHWSLVCLDIATLEQFLAHRRSDRTSKYPRNVFWKQVSSQLRDLQDRISRYQVRFRTPGRADRVKVGVREHLLFDVPNYRVAKNEDVAVLDIPPELQLKALPLRKTPVQAERRVRASQYFRSFWAAWRTIAGYEAVHMNRKGQACESAAGAKVGLLQRFIVSLFAATN